MVFDDDNHFYMIINLCDLYFRLAITTGYSHGPVLCNQCVSCEFDSGLSQLWQSCQGTNRNRWLSAEASRWLNGAGESAVLQARVISLLSRRDAASVWRIKLACKFNNELSNWLTLRHSRNSPAIAIWFLEALIHHCAAMQAPLVSPEQWHELARVLVSRRCEAMHAILPPGMQRFVWILCELLVVAHSHNDIARCTRPWYAILVDCPSTFVCVHRELGITWR